MNKITNKLLELVSEFKGSFNGAFNIREDGQCAGRQSTENIQITSKEDAPGIVVTVKPGTKNEKVYIPACITHSDFDDLVYNDFYIGENADVEVIAGCGIHADGEDEAQHNGIHRFYLQKGARVLYREKHIGIGTGTGARRINPVTDAVLAEGAVLQMDTVQLSGVQSTVRKTSAVLEDRAKVIVRERIMTDGDETAKTEFNVTLKGKGSGADLVSRSVARGRSHQEFLSCIDGQNECTGHSECDAILAENGTVTASPSLNALHVDAELIHEAAIGKIAGEQILKLQTLGLSRQEAEERIIQGFLE